MHSAHPHTRMQPRLNWAERMKHQYMSNWGIAHTCTSRQKTLITRSGNASSTRSALLSNYHTVKYKNEVPPLPYCVSIKVNIPWQWYQVPRKLFKPPPKTGKHRINRNIEKFNADILSNYNESFRRKKRDCKSRKTRITVETNEIASCSLAHVLIKSVQTQVESFNSTVLL